MLVSLSEKERQLLDAAAEVFRSPDYDVFSSVQYKEISSRSGWSYKSVQDYFTKPELRTKLVRHMTDQGEAASRIDPQQIVDALNDLSRSSQEALVALGEQYIEFNVEDPMLRSSMALWPFARHVGSEAGSEEIRVRLAEMYRVFDRQVESALNSWFVSNSDLIRPWLDYMSVAELSSLLIAMTEGLSIRHALAPDEVKKDLVGRGYALLIAGFIRFLADPTTDEAGPPQLARFDAQRASRGKPDPAP